MPVKATINYRDGSNNDSLLETDTVDGVVPGTNAEIDYQTQMKQIIEQAYPEYELDKKNSTLPFDKGGRIYVPVGTTDPTYKVVLKLKNNHLMISLNYDGF